MGKILDKIVQDDAAPSRNDLWLDGETLKANIHGKWKSISGGSSGAGVTIVDSVDKLDKNAPVGSMAAVAVGGGSKYQTFSKLCETIPPIAPDMSEEEVMEILKKMPIVNDIKFNIPNQIPQEVQGILALASSELIETGIMNNATILMMVVAQQGVMCAMQSSTGTVGPITIMAFNEEAQKYELNQAALQEFDVLFKSNTWVFLGKDFFSSVIGEITPESIAAMDEIFSLLSGAVAQAELYIKKEEWQKVLVEDIEAIYAKLDTKQNIINKQEVPFVGGLKPNIYYTDFVNNSNVLQYELLGHSTSLVYEEYIIELEVGDRSPSGLTFVDENGEFINIKWSNSISPTLNPNTTYLISISGNFAVFAQFINE